MAAHAFTLPGVETALAPRRFSMYPGVGARNWSGSVPRGIFPLAFRNRLRSSSAEYTRMVPYPPIPDIMGSTTLRAAATATAASNAFPPRSSTSTPTRVARGWAVETMPPVAIAGTVSATARATGPDHAPRRAASSAGVVAKAASSASGVAARRTRSRDTLTSAV